ncbi:MAG: ATP-binding protein [Segetibacter sp.]
MTGKQESLKEVSDAEGVILFLALVPHCDPGFYNCIINDYLPEGGEFAEFGGIRGTNHRGIIPTGETAQFVLAGKNLKERLEIQDLFSTDHNFYRKRILWLEPSREGEPKMSGRIILSNEVVEMLTSEKPSKPDFSVDFPAKLITTKMEWNDLVVHPETSAHIEHIKTWLLHNPALLKDEVLKRKVKPGYKALFFGPPGTGKTLTASLLGKYFDKDVYRIDLSTVVSKYIGETEKNLERVFHSSGAKKLDPVF